MHDIIEYFYPILFFLRISKILSISENIIYNFFINILLIVCVTNLAFCYLDDWIAGHTLYSIFFALIFYLIKFAKKNTKSSINKFTLFFLLAFINGHLGYLSIFFVFLSLIFFLNIKNFTLNVKKFYFTFFCLFNNMRAKTGELSNIYFTYPQLELPNAKFKNFYNNLEYPINFILRIFDHLFNSDYASKDIYFHSKILGYGPQLILGFLIALFLIFKKKSKMIFNFDKSILFRFYTYINCQFSANWKLRFIFKRFFKYSFFNNFFIFFKSKNI